MNEDFSMTAKVLSVGERLEVEVISAEYAEGVYWVIVGSDTEIFDIDGNSIEKNDIQVGDIVKIEYNGQVMMSYPPQIVARSISISK